MAELIIVITIINIVIGIIYIYFFLLMGSIEECISALEKLQINWKKSKGRVYSEEYIEDTSEKLSNLRSSVDAIIEASEEKEDSTHRLEFERLYGETEKLLRNLKVKQKQEDSLSNMAQFDISMVGKNLQMFKGTYKFLEDFIIQSEMLHDLLREEDREIFVKYIYNFKLSPQVRSILGRANRPTTFVELKKSLEEAYPNPRTLQQVLTELGTTEQGSSDITEFREKISELSVELSLFEIGKLENPSQETRDAIYKVSDSMALNIFMKGVNSEYQPILLANEPRTLSEAAQKCITAEKSLNLQNKHLFPVNRTGRYNEGDRYVYNGKSNVSRYDNRNDSRNNNRYDGNGARGNGRNNYNGNKVNYGGNRTSYNNSDGFRVGNYRGGRSWDGPSYSRNNNGANSGNRYGRNNGDYNAIERERGHPNERGRYYRAFPCTSQQGNSEGRMTEDVVHEAQN